MSYKDVKKILSKLTFEQQNFLNNQKYEARLSIKDWIIFLQDLAILDTFGDKVRQRYKVYWIVSIVFFIITLIFIPVITAFVVLPVLFLISFSYFIRIFLILKKKNLSNHLRLQVFPFLAAIKDDLNEKEKVNMHLNFSNPTDKSNLTRTIPNSSKRYPKTTTYFYSLPYFKASFTMQDGTEVNIENEDIIRKRSITKRSASGKIKSKEKYKIKHKFDLKIAFPKTRYQYLGTHPELYTELPDFHQFSLKTKQISLQLEVILPAESVLALFATAYKNVKPL
jgi:hypothetical protein